MAAGNLVDRNLGLCSSDSVELSHEVSDFSLLEDGLDADVVALRRIERKQLVTWKTCIPVDDLSCYGIKRNNHCACIPLDGLCWDILHSSVDKKACDKLQ